MPSFVEILVSLCLVCGGLVGGYLICLRFNPPAAGTTAPTVDTLVTRVLAELKADAEAKQAKIAADADAMAAKLKSALAAQPTTPTVTTSTAGTTANA